MVVQASATDRHLTPRSACDNVLVIDSGQIRGLAASSRGMTSMAGELAASTQDSESWKTRYGTVRWMELETPAREQCELVWVAVLFGG